MSEEVIAFTPGRQVLTFASLVKAKAILLRENHGYIVQSAVDLANRFSIDEMLEMWKVTLDKGGKTIPDSYKLDRITLAKHLWPLLISQGKVTRDMIFLKPEKAAIIGQVMYYCPYRPGKSDAQDLIYFKLPRQAKVLVDMFMEKIPLEGLPEHKFYKEVMNLKEKLNTRQDPWVVLNFYRVRLLEANMLRIVSDGKIRGTKIRKYGQRKGEV